MTDPLKKGAQKLWKGLTDRQERGEDLGSSGFGGDTGIMGSEADVDAAFGDAFGDSGDVGFDWDFDWDWE